MAETQPFYKTDQLNQDANEAQERKMKSAKEIKSGAAEVYRLNENKLENSLEIIYQGGFYRVMLKPKKNSKQLMKAAKTLKEAREIVKKALKKREFQSVAF